MSGETTAALDGLLRCALEHVSDGVLLVDAQGQVIYANGNAASLLDVTIHDVVGRPLGEVFPTVEGVELVPRLRAAMGTQEILEIEAELGPGHGWFAIRALPSPSMLTVCFQNIDERQAAARTQAALVATLEEALSRQHLTQSVIVALVEALTVVDVATAVLRLANRTLNTTVAGVALLTDEGSALRIISLAPLTTQAVEIASLPLTMHTTLTDSVRSCRALYHGTREELLADYPGQRAEAEGSECQAFASVPLTIRGRVLGALSLSWSQPRVFTEQDRSFAVVLAAQCAQAIERTQLISRHRDVSETLQKAMLPDAMPVVEGVELSACYLPATSDMTVGGDWYDAFTLEDGRVALAVGDVSGHGVHAAAVMGQVRNALRAYLIEGHGPALALGKLSALVERAEHDLFATVIVAIYDPTTGALVWANAGHPPLVLRDGSGARLLAGPVAAPIGVHGPDPAVDQHLSLGVGDAVVGYTDGLVERRDEDLGVGLDRLLAATEGASQAATGWCEGLVEAMLGSRPRADDICVLVLQRNS